MNGIMADHSNNQGTRTPDGIVAIQTDTPQRVEILETIERGREVAHARIIELIGKAQKKAAQGDMDAALNILATADIIADHVGDTQGKEMIATGINLLYGVTLRTEK